MENVPVPDIPFEVYLRHAGEAGLSWVCTNADTVDVLIGRVDPLTKEQIRAIIDRVVGRVGERGIVEDRERDGKPGRQSADGVARRTDRQRNMTGGTD